MTENCRDAITDVCYRSGTWRWEEEENGEEWDGEKEDDNGEKENNLFFVLFKCFTCHNCSTAADNKDISSPANI